jgi:catenin alpha
VAALQSGDAGGLERTSAAITGRSGRICGVVTAEMDNYEPGLFKVRLFCQILQFFLLSPSFEQFID